nr:hypothetical protein [Tanacetum cinerariifolium]
MMRKKKKKKTNDEEMSFDQRVSTPPEYELSDEKENKEGDDNDKEGEQVQDEEDDLYRDANINLEKSDAKMTDAQANQDTKDSHVTLTRVPPIAQQQSSSISSNLVSKFINPSLDTVDVAVQLQTNKLREEAQTENQEFLNQKDIITSYGDVVTLKRGRDDQDKDEDPSAGSNRGSKRMRSGGSSSKKYTTSITKTKAADCGQVKCIEDKVSRIWSLVKVVYDKHLEEIIVRRQDDQLYKFREGNFKRLRRQDIEDMLLLLVRNKLTNLNLEERRLRNFGADIYHTTSDRWSTAVYGCRDRTGRSQSEVPYNGNEDGNTASVPTASTNVPTASASVATISQDTACAYIASQSSGSQIKFEHINQIDEDNMEEMDIKWNMALLSMRANKFWKKTGKKISIQGSNVTGFDKSKVECFNCHKMGHFAREYRAPKSQDRGRRDNYRQGSKAEEQAPKALMAIDGVGWDLSYMANEEEDHALVADEVVPREFALMANTSTESKVFDNSLCSKDCKKNNNSLNSKIIDLTDKLFDANSYIYHYKLALAQVESRLVEYKEREIKYIEKIITLKFYNESNKECVETLKKKLETLKQEKEGVDGKLAGLLTASKDLDNLIESQMSDKNKEGLGYTTVPPPPAQLYLSPKKDLSWTGLPKCADYIVTDYSRPSHTVESTSEDDQNRNPSVSKNVASPITPKPFIKFVKPKDSQSESKIDKKETPKKPPVKYAEQYRKPNKKPNVRGN